MADADRALFVAGLEAAVVDAYRALLDRGALPAELTDTVLVLAQHHDEHCTALADIADTPRDMAKNPAAAEAHRLHAELLDASVTASHPRADAAWSTAAHACTPSRCRTRPRCRRRSSSSTLPSPTPGCWTRSLAGPRRERARSRPGRGS